MELKDEYIKELRRLRKEIIAEAKTDKDFALNQALIALCNPSNSEAYKWVVYYLTKELNRDSSCTPAEVSATTP
jgi:hypothetical protein